MSPTASHPNFTTLNSFRTEYAPTTITQYLSSQSHLRLIVVDRPGPKINGYFTLATEIHDDSGAPHTLEHLCFMGSRTYPYKGLLDKLAGRAYSSTNAWTAVDHTAYTLETAGWDGFKQILPVYLEHVVLPTITDEACVTEVWHVDGEGRDAGVVYSEMQALETEPAELMDLAARRLLYPKNVGFRYETGGMLENLRKLTPERIREFHRDMYRLKNMAIVVVGEVDHAELLGIVDKFETSVVKDVPVLDESFKRPWIESQQPGPIEKTVVTTVEFPEEDESVGEVLMAFFGPNVNDVEATTALSVLLTYLCGSSVSILENVIVEKEELASSVMQWWDGRPNTVIWFQPTGVATEKLETVEKRVIELLVEVASKPLDMTYIKECIAREKRQVKFAAESSESFYSQNIITDYLFGKRDGSTLASLQTLKEYDVIAQWSDEQWRAFLRKWFVDAHHISILGKPSEALSKKLKAAEEERLATRQAELGEDGLKKLGERLEGAKKKNDEPIPNTLLDQWPVPGTESIHFIESLTARAGKAASLGKAANEAQKFIDSVKPPKQPLFIQFENIPSNFVHFVVQVSTSTVPVDLKPFMGIFIDNFFNTPVNRDGNTIEFESVVMELEKDTISYEIRGGGRLGDAESIAIYFQTEPDKYTKIVSWLKTLMFDSIFDPVRLNACISKALADIPESKRDGRAMAAEVDLELHSKRDWLPMARRTLVQAVYLKRLRKLLKKDPETVISRFEELRKQMFTFSNTRVLIAADVEKLPGPLTAWDQLTTSLLSNIAISPSDDLSMTPIPPPHTHLSPTGLSPGTIGTILIPLPSLETSYSVSTTVGLKSYSAPDLPSLLVTLSYLEAVEGPLWTAVRGAGLAYGVSFGKDFDSGLLQFRVYRSPDASRAIAAARDTVLDLAREEVELDRHLLEGAVSGIVMGFADEQATMAAAAQQNYVNGVVRGLDKEWTKEVLRKVGDVKEEDVKRMLKEYVLPVFEAQRSNVVVTCANGSLEAQEKSFQAMGYKTQVKQLADYHDDYGIEDVDGEEDGDEDDDMDEGDGDEGSEDYTDEEGEDDEEEQGSSTPHRDEL